MSREHTCVICGNEFKTNYYGKRTCSNECAYKWNRMTKKECVEWLGHEWDDSVNTRDLIERDGLTCAICGLPCVHPDEAIRPYDNLRATIDHIIPLFSENGGDNTWDNVQIVHMLCNSNKNNGRNELDDKQIFRLRERISELLDERK